MAATAGAATANASHQQQQQQVFEEKHAELVAEARGVAMEFGVDVRAVAFRPAVAGGGAVAHEFQGIPPAARVVSTIRRAVARDVSAMGVEEVAQHERRLLALRTLVLRELQAKKKKAEAIAAAAAAKRVPEEKEEVVAGGESKIRRIMID